MKDQNARKRRIAQITRRGTDLAAETYREGITWDELVQIRDQLAALDEERMSLIDPHFHTEDGSAALGG